MDAESLACVCGILGLVTDNLKLLLNFILRKFNSEDAKGSDDGGSSWYTKLHNQLGEYIKKENVKQ